MLFITYSNIMSLTYFFTTVYIILISSLVVYLIPLFTSGGNNSYLSSNNTLNLLHGNSLINMLSTPFILIFTVLVSITSPSISLWFGHIIISGFQINMTFFLSISMLLIVMFYSYSYFSSSETYDYFITQINIFYWSSLLFYSNSLITMIFIIEVQSALLFLILITSTLSSNYFYSNLDFSSYNFFANQMPYSVLSSIMFFFWVSLLTSLNLFLFTIFTYQNLFSFDWYLIEHLFIYFISSANYMDIFGFSIYWFILLFSIFTKSGIAPFFIWKPTFFNGISLNLLYFYICFFYYSIFLYFIYLMTNVMHSILYYYSYVLITVIVSSIFVIIAVMCEASYLNTFLAISSILNSILVMLALSTPSSQDLIFFL